MGVSETEGESWSAPDVVSQFATRGFSDAGEGAAFAELDPWEHGDVLDIGIGGGRTTGLLIPLARSYVGVDIAPAMVDLAAHRYPDADVRIGDATDLAGLSDHAFDLVLFSYNGLDALGHADRGRSLAAMARVVRPGGRVLFSSLNLDGVSYDEHPWRLPGGWRSARTRFHVAYAARHPGSMVRSVQNFRHSRLRAQDGEGWGTRPMRAHEFRFVVHFATMEETVGEVRAAGLEVVAAYADDGRVLDPELPHTDADYVHFICRPV